MLKITIPGAKDAWDPIKEEFVTRKECTLRLEHSLISIHEWEGIFHVPFLNNTNMTGEQMVEYIKCMTLTPNVDPEVYNHLTRENMKDIQEYIADPRTATWFSQTAEQKNNKNGMGQKDIITSELVYYWMIAQNIPKECEKWHFSQLLTLIKVCSLKNEEANGKGNKMKKSQIYKQNSQLNAARRKKLHSKG